MKMKITLYRGEERLGSIELPDRDKSIRSLKKHLWGTLPDDEKVLLLNHVPFFRRRHMKNVTHFDVSRFTGSDARIQQPQVINHVAIAED